VNRPQPLDQVGYGRGPASEESSPADVPAPAGNGSVIHGEVVTDEQRAASELAQEKEQAAAERLPLPPTFRRELRMQLADFAERAHQKRLNPESAELLGSGGGITEAVVAAMARAISTQDLRGPGSNDEDRMDLLLGALAATDPNHIADPGHVSFVTLRGRLMLDVSTAAIDGESLDTQFVRLPSRSAPADQDAVERGAETPDRVDGSSARFAAVICGPAGIIADGRPFLGMDALTTFARRQAYLHGSDDGGPQAAFNGMRAAHNIEIVVLLDRSLGGGVWVDVDPATGSPAAAMLIDVKPAGFRFTPLAAA
jgi:hypothetical protein